MVENTYCFTESEIIRPREAIIELMDMMIRYNLTDFSGGNVALKVGDKIYITQRHSADRYRWQLKPDQIIVTDLNANVLEGNSEKISREGDLHFGILKRFPEYSCTLHGNSFYSPLVVSTGLAVTGITEVAQYYKIKNIPITPEDVPNLSDEENRIVWSYFEELKKRDEAPVVIMPYHGIIVAGKDANEAFSLFHAVETNSKFILFQNLLKTSVVVNEIFSKISSELNGQVSIKSNSDIYPDNSTKYVNKQNENSVFLEQRQLEADKKESNSAQKITEEKANEEISDKTQGGSVTVEEKAYRVEKAARVFTAEDLNDIIKNENVKKIIIADGVKITDFAEIRADALGIQLIKESTS
ncbi:MAG: class II aldolase/adducin family protein [Actinobacteria bacterium]|nr:class II aldolase/adducin family protein [Actinomycetota bacterium]